MGGVDLALAWNTQAMNSNPAGITRLGYRLDFSTAFLMPKLTLSDKVIMGPEQIQDLNSDAEGESLTFPIMSMGFVAPVWKNLHLGLGFAVQGGMGSDFQGLSTMTDPNPMEPMGATDQPQPSTYGLQSEVAYMKLTPTLAYRFKNLGGMDLSLGMAGNIGFATMSFMHDGFAFPEMDGDHVYAQHKVDYESDMALGYALRMGILAEWFGGDLSAGISYQTEATLPFKGSTTLDSQLEYDAEIEFGWPQELGIGLAGRPLRNLTLAADIKWVNWSSTMDEMLLKNSIKDEAQLAQMPEQMKASMKAMDMPFKLGWSDQWVLNLGTEYIIKEYLKARMGYSWGQNPVDGAGINPLFPAVTQHHITFGLGSQFGPLEIDLALEVVPQNSVVSDANNQMSHEPMPAGMPEGAGNGYELEAGMSQLSAHMAMGYKF